LYAGLELLEEVVGRYFEKGIGNQEDHECDSSQVSTERADKGVYLRILVRAHVRLGEEIIAGF
jgi:hypothetical protein